MHRRSFAREHFIRTTAAEEAAKLNGTENQTASGTAYELMLMQLREHKGILKNIQSLETKAEKKVEFLPEYIAYVDGVLEANTGVQDNVLMEVLVWRVDVGDLFGALQIAKYALAHNLTPPEQYNRTTATIIAEEVAEFINRTDKTDHLYPLASEAEELTREKDMPDQVRAKLHKAIGKCLIDSDKKQDALQHYQRALQLDKNSGVKKIIEKLERDIKNAS